MTTALTSLLLLCANEGPEVLTETGRDYPETRLYTACRARLDGENVPLLAVGGFTDTGHSALAELAIYAIENGGADLRWRTMWKAESGSQIRTLRAADLDGNGHDELIALGRRGQEGAQMEGELRVLGIRNDGLAVLDVARWQSDSDTHGYGMDIGDLDGDGAPEIVTGGFFSQGDQDRAEVRVWAFRGGRLGLVNRVHWGERGHTRINSIALGDIDGDGRPEIVTAGRTGQVKDGEETLKEADQLTAWQQRGGKLDRLAVHEGPTERSSRFREVKIARINPERGPEIFAAGRAGDEMRPCLRVFRLANNRFEMAADLQWDREHLGEIRDIVLHGNAENFRVLTIAANGLKPNRRGEITVWRLNTPGHTLVAAHTALVGDETRIRQAVLWPVEGGVRVLTVGFSRIGTQHIGQILAWGILP